MCLALALAAGCGPASAGGTVGIRLTADIRAPRNLAALDVVIETVGVHRAGQPITAGWMTWVPPQHQVELMALGTDGAVSLGAGPVAVGRYDRARVVVEAGQARAPGSLPIPLTLSVEPIAIPFEVRAGDAIEITVELIALPQTDGRYELFTKAATLQRR